MTRTFPSKIKKSHPKVGAHLVLVLVIFESDIATSHELSRIIASFNPKLSTS